MAYTKKDQLIDRINGNFDSFKCSLDGVSRAKLFDGAERIAAVKETHRALTDGYDFEDGEAEFYLLFRDPLTIVADAWENRDPTADFDDVMFDLACDESIITEYPLMMDGCLNDVLNTGAPDGHRMCCCCGI